MFLEPYVTPTYIKLYKKILKLILGKYFRDFGVMYFYVAA